MMFAILDVAHLSKRSNHSRK